MLYGESLKSPLIKLVGEVIVLACHLLEETNIPSLSYWQAFRHPERDYRRPD
jgi:hypothetical protein